LFFDFFRHADDHVCPLSIDCNSIIHGIMYAPGLPGHSLKRQALFLYNA
jgi:hypothetical protein